MRAKLASALALGLALAVPAPATAQVPGINFNVIPKLGAFFPVGDLAEIPLNGQDERVQLASAFALGLGLELELPLVPFNVRGNLEFVPSTTVSPRDNDLELDADLLALVVDAVFHPMPRLIITRPYIIGGIGVKRYSFGNGSAALAAALPASTSDFTLHLGAGLDTRLGPLRIVAELSDYISRFSPEQGSARTQNDFFLMVGASVTMF